jgi:endoglucanase
MADRAAAERWLAALTSLPTASGLEHRVAEWVGGWVRRRPDLSLRTDSGGNLFITRRDGSSRPHVFLVAHMDHPAFVITAPDGAFEFRGHVDAAYFDGARIDVVSRLDGPTGEVVSYDPETGAGNARFEGEVRRDDIAMWRFGADQQSDGRFRAPACDDLAGVAAALAALDRARGEESLGHVGVMLTRAEEVGLVGAIHAAKHETIPRGSLMLSIETSRQLPNARIGEGPIVRIGDRVTVFDRELSNAISAAASRAGLRHQRKLMDGGGCEATAFGAYGYRSTGLCLALGNWHNRGNLEAVEGGNLGAAVPMLEEISLDDFHGLVDLLVLSAGVVEEGDGVTGRLDELYESTRHYLG